MSCYRRADADVDVLLDRTWYAAHLRAWDQREGEVVGLGAVVQRLER